MDFNILEDEFEIITDFKTWLYLMPILKDKGYKRVSYSDGKGYKIGYFKKCIQ